jgi:hypothetical protein
MEKSPHRSGPGNGRAMAQSWIPLVLEVDLQGPDARWQKTDAERDSGVDLPDGRRKRNVGRSAHPWRTPHAWI